VKAENSITQHLLATFSMKLQGKKREQLKQEKLKTLKKSGIPLSEYKKLVKKEA